MSENPGGDTPCTLQRKSKSTPSVSKKPLIDRPSLLHLLNMRKKSSVDTVMYAIVRDAFGKEQADYYAEGFGWKINQATVCPRDSVR
ncbi:MAG: hypothetical protein DMF61_21465 [Blastocatellia bacterium AA13]|nr:MAG: hypothetical protein DMF61_21465 [Blastocatellia bacterium AA13]